ncbi:MAG TPA: tetratricopeptide repeat protein [Gemmatimonadales bacterium]|nr:tetratricopeptide repeat protein [Gemmatimonadales bacterium]
MATMVEATTRDQAPAPAAAAPWYRDSKRLLIGAAVAVLLLGVVAWVVISSERRKEQFAARSLNQARAAAEAGNLPLASSELQRLIDTYGGTDAATEAVITLNQVRLINGQGELAAVGLREFIDRDPPEKYLAPAYGLLGTALENSKRPAEAADAFRNASRAADIEYLKARYLIDAGRAYRAAGKPEEARAAYRAIIDSFPQASSVTEAKVRLAELTDGRM